MIRALLVSAVALAAGSALAADLPARTVAPIAPAPLAYNWTGFYVGAHAGYAWHSGDFQMNGPFAAQLGYPAKSATSPAGFIGGFQAGYNYQINQIVVGAEADVGFTSGTDRGVYYGANGGSLNVTSKGSMLSTVRLRTGYAIDRALIYVTGGFAFSNTKAEGTLTVPAGTPVAQGVYSGNVSGNRQGWALGAGFEYALTNNITARAEYLYYNVGDKNFQLDPNNTTKIQFDGNVARLGVNYKF